MTKKVPDFSLNQAQRKKKKKRTRSASNAQAKKEKENFVDMSVIMKKV